MHTLYIYIFPDLAAASYYGTPQFTLSSQRKLENLATYFQGTGSEIQASPEGLQTLYLMNPNNYVPYTDNTQHPATPNMFFLNPSLSGNALNLSHLSHAPSPTPQHPLYGITLPPNMTGSRNSDDPGRSSFLSHHEISGVQGISAPRFQYQLWGPVIDQTASPAAGTATACSGGVNASTGLVDGASQMGFWRSSQQGLSLSLSSQQKTYRSLSGEIDVQTHSQLQALSPTCDGSDDIRVQAANSQSFVSNGITGMQSAILGSKYLKAAQELLDEVVNVGQEVNRVETVSNEKMKMNTESTTAIDFSCSTGNNNSKQGADLNTAQKQELQMKKSKLVGMLDEVEQRYRQYHHQMQIVVSSFEQAAGLSVAKSYTTLALKTISKQFRCLKDAICSQIKVTSNRLGEDDCLGAKREGSRLRFVDHHLQQQKALQHLGMIQHNAWRPQRGLPERAVSVLRAWLFEHFLHPYPKDSDKVLLAKQTGLTRSQVSNWFINARVRLWKPMVEEMYTEEQKEQEQNNAEENSSRSKQPNNELAPAVTPKKLPGVVKKDHMKPLQSSNHENFSHHNVCPTEISNSSILSSALGGSAQSQSGFVLMSSSDMQRSQKKTRNPEMQNCSSSIMSLDMGMKPGETDTEANVKFEIDKRSKDGFSFLSENPNQGGVPYGVYSMGDIGSFNVPEQLAPRFHGNGVSLTLGLPHSENLPLSGTQHGMGYLPLHNMQLGKFETGANGTEINTPHSSYSSNRFDNNIDVQNRKRFDAHNLLPDFVS